MMLFYIFSGVLFQLSVPFDFIGESSIICSIASLVQFVAASRVVSICQFRFTVNNSLNDLGKLLSCRSNMNTQY